MFAISKTVSQIPRCTYRLTDNVVGLASEITRKPIQSSPKQKKPVQRRLHRSPLAQFLPHALQSELFGLPPTSPPELVDFQGFLFKNRQQLIRLEKDTVQRKQLELIKSS